MDLNFTEIAVIITIVSGTLTILMLLIKPFSKMKQENKKIYSDFFGYTYSQLFEYKKSDERPNIRFHSDDFNPIDISSFCNKVVDFKNKGNKFKNVRIRILFNRLYNTAKKLDKETDGKYFAINAFLNEDDTYLKYYEKNKQDFNKLKARFKRFYLSIYPILD